MLEPYALHPITVHVPLVLIPVAVLLGLLDLLAPRFNLRPIALVLLFIGTGAAALSVTTGELASEQARAVDPAVQEIIVAGSVPEAIGHGRLLHTHSELGEQTRNLYSVLLAAEGVLFFFSSPLTARYRGARTISAGTARVARVIWLVLALAGIVLVVLTGHYGGQLVYEHGVGVIR